ncbi:MipA/OmpV family protein [Niveispirillum sp. SYP-B3756]|uniref:MipA/OmpV family protein n=1 Tax=Niveispirillum sp. SYP-B3756 TaxID=2662178 RepID=UPI0012923195|nr:MipA/OmpV family protein [Niveispirillum sp. SYP-B3756]MQP67349.1 MipA/OmpV family protein [Niveispirillum sp. SYP-B3756]
MVKRLLLLAALLGCTPLPAQAGSLADVFTMPDIRLSAGPGMVLGPHYPGASGSHLQPYPYVDGQIGNSISFDSENGLRLTLLSLEGLEAGLAAGYRAGRATHDMPADLRPLQGVDEAITLGSFASYSIGPFSLDVEAWRDAVPGRQRLMLEIESAINIPFGDPAERKGISFGPYLEIASDGFQQTYFGIDAGQAADSGFRPFYPKGGPLMAGLDLESSFRLYQSWSLAGFANWGRMLSDAARSPLVRQGGSRDQLSSGLFLVYDF